MKSSIKRKIIIQAAITGAVHTPSMSPYLPITPKDIISEIIRSYDAGASMVHIHARDPETGAPSSDLNLFGEILSNVKAKCNVICGVTTGGGQGMTIEERISIVPKYEPELASLDMGSFNFAMYQLANKVKDFKHPWEEGFLINTDDYVFRNTFKELRYFSDIMKKHNTKVELEIFDVSMVNNTLQLIKEGYLQKPLYLQYVMGVLGGAPASVEMLSFLIKTSDELLKDYVWSACGASMELFALLSAALALGGNIRVGLEDNLYISKGVLAKSNAEQVEKAVRIVKLLGYEIATPSEAREILQLKGLDKVKY